jgi:hypothetical protein
MDACGTPRYEHDLRLLARRQGAPPSPDVLREEACALRSVPKDCPPDRFPTCGTYVRLTDLATTLCKDPVGELPSYENTDADFGRAERR